MTICFVEMRIQDETACSKSLNVTPEVFLGTLAISAHVNIFRRGIGEGVLF